MGSRIELIKIALTEGCNFHCSDCVTHQTFPITTAVRLWSVPCIWHSWWIRRCLTKHIWSNRLRIIQRGECVIIVLLKRNRTAASEHCFGEARASEFPTRTLITLITNTDVTNRTEPSEVTKPHHCLHYRWLMTTHQWEKKIRYYSWQPLSLLWHFSEFGCLHKLQENHIRHIYQR